MNTIDLPKIRIIVHSGERFGHQKGSYTLMKRLRELGFKGQFEILYEDLYPEHIPIAKYTNHVANSLPTKNTIAAHKSLETQHKIYFHKLLNLMRQLLPKYQVEHDHIAQVLKNQYYDNATKIKKIDDIANQAIISIEAELLITKKAHNNACKNLVRAFQQEIIKKKDMELLDTQVRLSCEPPTKYLAESAANSAERQLLKFIHDHNDSMCMQLVYGLKALPTPRPKPTVIQANVGYMGRKLEIIFSGYLAPDIRNQTTRNLSVDVNHPVLGDLKVTRLPFIKSEWQLDHAPLSFIAATDIVLPNQRPTIAYSTDICVITKLSNWKGTCFIDVSNQSHPIFIENELFSFSYHNKNYCINLNDNPAIIAICESLDFFSKPNLQQALQTYRRTQEILREESYKDRAINLLKTMRFHKSADHRSIEAQPISFTKEYRCPIEQLRDIIAIYNNNKNRLHSPYVLLIPNFHKIFQNISKDELIKGLGINVKIIDSTDKIDKNEDSIYILCTGNLHPEVIDYLMTLPNMLPTIIEGCSATELCEFSGSPFLLTNHHGYTVQNLPSDDINFNRIQKLHINASLYLSHGKEEQRPEYINYMRLAIDNPQALEKYSQQRKKIYRDTRSDVINRSLKIIAAVDIQSQLKLFGCVKPSLLI